MSIAFSRSGHLSCGCFRWFHHSLRSAPAKRQAWRQCETGRAHHTIQKYNMCTICAFALCSPYNHVIKNYIFDLSMMDNVHIYIHTSVCMIVCVDVILFYVNIMVKTSSWGWSWLLPKFCLASHGFPTRGSIHSPSLLDLGRFFCLFLFCFSFFSDSDFQSWS